LALAGDFLSAGTGGAPVFGLLAKIAAFAVPWLPNNEWKDWTAQIRQLAELGWRDAEGLQQARELGGTELPSLELTLAFITKCLEDGTRFDIDGLARYCECNTEAAALVVERIEKRCATNPGFRQHQRLATLHQDVVALERSLRRVRGDAEAQRSVLEHLKKTVGALRALGAPDSDLEDLAAAVRQFVDSDFARYLLSQPRFPLPSSSVLHFTSRKVAFVGREGELARLEEFCEADQEVLWWAVTGPGGIGKSRLAYEFCQRIEGRGWRAQFLRREFFDGPATQCLTWDFPQDLLLVVDYAACHGGQVGQWLTGLQGRRDHKLRVLILERESFADPWTGTGQPRWYLEMANDADRRELEHLRHGTRSSELTLEGTRLDDAQMSRLLSSLKIPPPASAAMLGRLSEIDPGRTRPLYLLFLALARIRNPGDDRWATLGLEDLHDMIYEHERARLPKFWAVDAKDAALDICAYATVTGPVKDLVGALSEHPHLRRLQPASVAVEGGLPSFVGTIRQHFGQPGRSSGADVVPYEPDIPGEYIALRRLVVASQSAGMLESVLDAAWATRPWQTADFLSRAARDFINATPFGDLWTSEHLLRFPATRDLTQNPSTRLAFARVLGDLSFERGLAGRQQTVARLEELAARFPTDPAIARSLATSLANIAVEQSLAGRQQTVARLGKLMASFPTDSIIAAYFAMTLTNLSAKQALAGRQQTAARLGKLAARFPTESAIAVSLATTLSMQSLEQNLARCQRTVARLEELAARFPTDTAIARCIAVALARQSYEQDQAGCQRTVARLEELAARFPADPVIAFQLAVALGNLPFEHRPS
jgi:hypothetical protein